MYWQSVLSRLGYGCAALLVAWAVSGCASSKLDMPYQEQWAQGVSVSDAGIIEVSEQGEQVVVLRDVNERNLTILDGSSGSPVREQKQSLFSRALGQVEVGGGLTVGDLRSDSYEYVMLEDMGMVLLFNFNVKDNIVRGIDLVSGEEVWESRDYVWSNEKYKALVGKVAADAAGDVWAATGSMTAAGAVMGTADVLTQKRPVERLIVPIPGQDAFVFKTKDGLFAVDAQTGGQLWHLPEFQGTGVSDVVVMPDGDLLITGLYDVDYLGSLVSDFTIVRVDPETGEARWMTDFAGLAVRDIQVVGDRLVIDARKLQVFDLESGELLWDRTARISEIPLALITDDAIFLQIPAEEGDGFVLSRRDLHTGEEDWQQPIPRDDSHAVFADGAVLVATSGEPFDGRGGVMAFDAASGAEQWRSEPFEEAGRQLMTALRDELRGVETTNVLVDGGRAYVAGPKSFYGFDVETGEQLVTTPHMDSEIGMAIYLQDLGENVALVSQEGVSFYEKSSGERLATTSLGRSLKWFHVDGARLFALHGDHLNIVNINTAEREVEVPFDALKMNTYGNLGDGYEVTGGGRDLFLLDSDGELRKFSLVR